MNTGLGLRFFILYSSFVFNCVNLVESMITCSDFTQSLIGYMMYKLRSRDLITAPVSLFIATNSHPDPYQVDINNLVAILSTIDFNPREKTFIITHGYRSGSDRKWVSDLKNGILKVRRGNVILVDWSLSSNKKNYVDSVHGIQDASQQVYKFLQKMIDKVKSLGHSSGDIKWNHLHFLGHSLGAHLSGQVAHLLKSNQFWRVERITGFDPANPCFKDIDLNLKLDAGDAELVDIIHTQSGLGTEYNFGLRQKLGHIDFWVNGGLEQPNCSGKGLLGELDMRICNHRMSYQYFIDSLDNTYYGGCQYSSYKWDGTYRDAKYIINSAREGTFCSECPTLGLDLTRPNQNGDYMVITGSQAPYCSK
ncbi:hypothetical protein QAD02_023016 [Eretmocerus hayati]|uniref:Uncharacterized protein n=1 Tax=Eretmocerus hayati TaxID=131215 RepID=A0ACC2PY02_9HYME|nr:hypothetical protein QAD02_023016 [Eretmocerus hayati]